MNISKKFYFFILGVFLICSSVYANGISPQSKPPAKSTVKKTIPKKPASHKIVPLVKTISLPPFYSIETDGNFDVVLVPGQPRVEIKNSQANSVHIYVSNGVLHLNTLENNEKNAPQNTVPINVRVATQNLNDLVLSDGTAITAQNVYGRDMVINVGDQSHVVLNGYINISKIIAGSDSYVNIHWVNSTNLAIVAHDHSEIYLAGVANRMVARLRDNAHLDAKYLRAKEAWVKTKDSAIADVLATNSLSAFASDNSNIYYYKNPTNLVEYSQLSGNVLQMDYWY